MSDIDVKKALQQHLQSLRWSGVSDLPGGGELNFDLSALAVAAEDQPPSRAQDRLQPPSSGRAPVPTSAAIAGSRAATKTPKPPPKGSQRPALAAESKAATPAAIVQPTVLRPGQYRPPITDLAQRQTELATIATEVNACQKCPELCRNRINTVFGVGPADAKIVFVGEGPGATEDAQGEPFVGAAGQLLNRILTASKLPRDQVYILNVVKCRPPANRTPSDSEVQNCWDYLHRQLDVIQPTHIVCLGSVAAKAVLNTKSSLGKLRKQFHQYCGSKVVATYHPAYLLRTEAAKEFVWEDMKMLMRDLGVEL